jgi:pilus assembly protein CpaC
VRNTSVSDPTVVDLLPMSSGQFILTAKTPGHTDIRFFDGAGKPILTMNIRVEMDTAALASTIARVVPKAQVQVEAIDQSIVLTGHADSIGDADAAVQIARLAVAKPENVLNRITLSDKDQVLMKVRIVEVQRNVLKQFGVDLNAVIGQLSGTNFNFASAASFAVNNGLQGGATGTFTSANRRVTSTVQAFERNGLIRTLAEPDLTAVSGEAAKFLAGGEFPVPTSVDTSGHVSVDFKPFGIGLGFTPVVLSGGRISLKLSTEVSELSSTGAFTIAGPTPQSSLSVPALVVRRANTVVELPSGGSMMIGGLISQSTRENIDKVPGVADVPVLGALARSRDFLSGETEIVMLVTAYIVKASEPGMLQSPADGLRMANDAQTLLMGKVNQAYGVKPSAVAGRSYEGAFGHVIE